MGTKMSRSTFGLDSSPDDPNWRRFAKCTPANADLFTVGTGGGLSPGNYQAVALCGLCRVLRQCNQDITDTDTDLRRGLIVAGRFFDQRGREYVPDVFRRRPERNPVNRRRRPVTTAAAA
jgi:hypothetical protein